MTDLFLPTLHTFAMNNVFTGSVGMFRFRAKRILRSVFPPYSVLAEDHPVLQRCPLLLPFVWIFRIFSRRFSRIVRRSPRSRAPTP